MPSQVRCPCHGNPECQLCHGEKFYPYQPGPQGWMPFRCPTCQGTRVVRNARGQEEACFTCQRAGTVDPANPPFDPGWRGTFRIAWKTFFGGG